jgi:hypothetical protein
MVAANPHGASASQELPGLLFLLLRGLTSSGTSRLLPIVYRRGWKNGGIRMNKILSCWEIFLEEEV